MTFADLMPSVTVAIAADRTLLVLAGLCAVALLADFIRDQVRYYRTHKPMATRRRV